MAKKNKSDTIASGKASENKSKVAENSTSNDVGGASVITEAEVIGSLVAGYDDESSQENQDNYNKTLNSYLQQEIDGYAISKDYNLLILFDNSTMMKSDADSIYNAVTNFKDEKKLLLVLLSNGGEAGSAYLIGKLCREYSKEKFVVVVPRQAKSAATLLCCAADEIHMGSLSELGPIDPQIKGLPALGLKNSVEHIAELVSVNKEASEMFAKYLSLSIEPIQIGYYERVAESAVQYAENLLVTHKNELPKNYKMIANDLVYKYKDHGYVIDKSEALKIFGDKVIKHNTDEYKLGNSIYKILDINYRVSKYLNYIFYFIGDLNSKPTLRKKK